MEALFAELKNQIGLRRLRIYQAMLEAVKKGNPKAFTALAEHPSRPRGWNQLECRPLAADSGSQEENAGAVCA